MSDEQQRSEEREPEDGAEASSEEREGEETASSEEQGEAGDSSEEQQDGTGDVDEEEDPKAVVHKLEEEGPPEKLEDWPQGKAKYETFGGPEGEHGYHEGPEQQLGPSSLRHHEEGEVSIAGEEVDNPDEFKGEPIPGGPTDPDSPDAKGEESKGSSGSEGSSDSERSTESEDSGGSEDSGDSESAGETEESESEGSS